MHPVLLRIPLPSKTLPLWWILLAVALFAVVSLVSSLRRSDKNAAILPGLVAAACGGWAATHWAETVTLKPLPIYSFGVMLGLSLVVAWFLTLELSDREGMPREPMGNTTVFAMFMGIVGARALYVLTNLDEFQSLSDMLALRRGGLVAYGGYVAGFLASVFYVNQIKQPFSRWIDCAMPGIAIGMVTGRIGCYLYGCDFGKPLGEGAPAWLKAMGTFPHWPAGTLDAGDGAPAYLRHLEVFGHSELLHTLKETQASLPVHPTQIYESLVGVLLLVTAYLVRRRQSFQGEIGLTVAFGYGLLRFSLELLRDDAERGSYGPAMPEHVLIPFAFALFALAFVVGPATSIAASTVRSAASVLAFGPALGAYLVMRPGEFEPSMIAQFSTSQLIGLGSAMIAAAFWSHLRSLMGGAPYTRPGEREGRKVAVEVVAPAEAA
jgi:phosphatidylglycerol---prolipoprotein diacylglyceryl transferase